MKKLELSPQNFCYDVLHLLYSGANRKSKSKSKFIIVSMLTLLFIIKTTRIPFEILFEFTIGNLQSFEGPNLIFYTFQNIISYHLSSLRINFSAKKHCLLMRNQHVETHVKGKSQTMDTPRYKGKKYFDIG